MRKFSVGDSVSFKNSEYASVWRVKSNVGVVRQITQSYRHVNERMVIAAFGETLVYMNDESFSPADIEA